MGGGVAVRLDDVEIAAARRVLRQMQPRLRQAQPEWPVPLVVRRACDPQAVFGVHAIHAGGIHHDAPRHARTAPAPPIYQPAGKGPPNQGRVGVNPGNVEDRRRQSDTGLGRRLNDKTCLPRPYDLPIPAESICSAPMSQAPIPSARDIVVVHSSDLHLDHDYTARLHGGDGTAGLAGVLRAARAATADVVILAGDTFDCHRLPLDLLDRAAAVIAAAALPVIVL